MACIRLIFSVLLISGIILVINSEEQTEGEGSYLEQVHRLYEDELEDPSSIRVKRDVLKGRDRDLTRSKRYIGRVPLSYMKKVAYDPYSEDDEDDLIPPSGPQNAPARAPSHFREFQVKQNQAPNPKSSPSSARNDLTIEEPKMLSAMSSNHRNQRRYIPNTGRNAPISSPDEDEISPLSDSDIQSLLLLIDGYELKGNSRMPQQHPNSPTARNVRPELYYTPQGYISPQDLERIAQMYEVGKKRETGKRSTKQYELEQPMSFDNSLYPGDRLEFLTDKRSKRIGARNLMAKTTKQASSSNRFKKETDPEVLAILSRVFSEEKVNQPSKKAMEHDEPSANIALAPSMGNHYKSKKSIDWSNYLGIDKRAHHSDHDSHNQKSKAIGDDAQGEKVEASVAVKPTSQASPLIKDNPTGSSTAADSAVAVNKGKAKDTNKKVQNREENATVNKEDDRNWMLHEFYKNFAMSTNVKRKRESPSVKPKNDLEKLEELQKKMTAAGDKIIWDALKYTGSHRDEQLSPSELAQVKNSVIQKLSTAYSLEKVREAMEELHDQIKALEERNKE